MADVSVRAAVPGDAAEIGRVQVQTWRIAFSDHIPPFVLESLTPEYAGSAWAAAVATPPSRRHHVLVALEGAWTVGFVALEPAAGDLDADDPDADATVTIGPLLVEPRWGRRGHGSRLLAAAVEFARGDGMTRAVTWILEGDEVSRQFLVSAGWAPDGLARALDSGAGEVREIRLHTSLTAEHVDEATG